MDKKHLILIGGIAAAVIAMIMFNIRNIDNFSFYQTDDIIKKGNKEFDNKKYDNALKEYKKVDLYDTLNYGAEYNEANSDFEKGQYKMADSIYKSAVQRYLAQNIDKKEMVDDDELAHIYHNKGNANMKQTMPIDSVILYQEMMDKMSEGENQQALQSAYPSLAKSWENAKNSIEDYKNALRRDAQNDSTRYNLALAQDYEKRLRDLLQNMTPPQNQNQQNQNQQDQQDQQKQDQQDKKDQQDQQNDQNNKEDERKETNEKNGQKDDQIPDLSKENAEQILKAIEKDEENTLKKIPLSQRNKNQQRRHIEKNW